jgi:uncharacterized protein DUF992
MNRLVTIVVAAAAALVLVAGPAHAQRAQIGTLSCDVSGGIGLIVGSQRTMNCVFTPATPGPVEYYTGSITKIGIDIGVTAAAQLVWAVHTSTSMWRGALTGSYVGATAEATLGAGLGANVLVGGNNRSVALQPLSIQGQIGLNVAAGVADLELRYVR